MDDGCLRLLEEKEEKEEERWGEMEQTRRRGERQRESEKGRGKIGHKSRRKWTSKSVKRAQSTGKRAT